MISYSEQLKGRTVLWRPAGVEDWCDPRVVEGAIRGSWSDSRVVVELTNGERVRVNWDRLTLARKVAR